MGQHAWRDGKFLAFEQAHVHLLAHSLHYGYGAFEGIRCYEGADGKSYIFRLHEHIERLKRSCDLIGLRLPVSVDQIEAGCIDLIRKNGHKECYIRPLAFLDYGPLGLFPGKEPVGSVAVFTWAWGKYLGDESQKIGIRCKISPFARISPTSNPCEAKATGNYINSVLAKSDAIREGFAEAILLDQDGHIAEGAGENIFVVKNGHVSTPSPGSILKGITRQTIITLLNERGIAVEEKNLTKDDLFKGDEVFFTGTASEICGISEINSTKIGSGKLGPLTAELLKEYLDLVHNKNHRHPEWLAAV